MTEMLGFVLGLFAGTLMVIGATLVVHSRYSS